MRLTLLVVAGLLVVPPLAAEEQAAPGTDRDTEVGQEPKEAEGAALPGTASGEGPAAKGSTAGTRTPGCDSLNDPVMRIRCVRGEDHVP